MTTTYSLNISSQDEGMNSSTNVTTDNVEDLQRLLQLAGMHSDQPQAANPGYVSSADAQPANVAQVVQVDPATDMQNLRRMAGFGQESDCCPECGESPCCCGDEHEQEAMMYENADHDYSENEELLDDEGNPIDVENYTYHGPKQAQRISHFGVDNSLSETLFDRIQQQWADFLSESEMSNEPGIMSPLTHPNRPDFDKDPTGGEEPVTDGTRSPMSNVKRQKVLQK